MRVYMENAEMVSINPLYPPIFGELIKLGDTPRPPGRKYPARLFQRITLKLGLNNFE